MTLSLFLSFYVSAITALVTRSPILLFVSITLVVSSLFFSASKSPYILTIPLILAIATTVFCFYRAYQMGYVYYTVSAIISLLHSLLLSSQVIMSLFAVKAGKKKPQKILPIKEIKVAA